MHKTVQINWETLAVQEAVAETNKAVTWELAVVVAVPQARAVVVGRAEKVATDLLLEQDKQDKQVAARPRTLAQEEAVVAEEETAQLQALARAEETAVLVKLSSTGRCDVVQLRQAWR